MPSALLGPVERSVLRPFERAYIEHAKIYYEKRKTDLMIPQPQIAQKSVVLHDVFTALLQARLVLEVQVSLEESAIELDDLAEGKVLAGRLV